MSDAFISYAREDQAFVRWLHDELVGQGREVWVDWEGIAPVAEWRDEIVRAIDAADSFVCVVSPDSLRSSVCSEELAHAGAQNKRIVPVVLREPGDVAVPDLVAERNWVFCREPGERATALALVVEALDTDLEWVRAHTRLLVRAREWESSGGSRALLLRGSDLSGAEADVATHSQDEPAPTELQRRYVLASRRSATRRLRTAMGVSLAALVAIGILAVIAVIQARDARETAAQDFSRRLAADANSQLAADPQLSLLLALEAYDTRPTIDAQSAVRQATLENRERAQFVHHSDEEVVDVAISGDGTRLATASLDGTARVWDLTRPRSKPRSLRGRDGQVHAVALTDDGRYVATASGDHARIWDVHHPGADPRTLDHPGVRDVAFSPDGSRLATAGDDKVARVWALGEPSMQPVELPATSPVNAVAFSPNDGRYLATALDDHTAEVWDWAAGTPAVAVLTGHTDPVHGVAFSPDGSRLATASYDGTARVWEWQTASEITRLAGHGAGVQSVAFSRDGTRLVTGSIDQTARVWRWQEPTSPPIVLRGHKGAVWSAVFLPSGSQVVTGSGDTTAALWDVARSDIDPVELHREDADASETVDDRVVRAIAFANDREQIATGGHFGARVWHWQEPNSPPVVLQAGGARVLDVAFSPASRYLATASDDWFARVWDLRRRADEPFELGGHMGTVHSVAFSPKATFLATSSYDGTAKVFQWPHPLEVGAFGRDAIEKIDVAVNRDDAHVATSRADGTTEVWDAYDTSKKAVAVLRQPGKVISIAFSPDGRLLGTAGDDHVARIWDWRERSPKPIELRGHNGSVLGIAFSPDGSRVATASTDGTVRVWDWRHPDARPLVLPHASGVWSLAFGPDSRHLATGSEDGIARVWDCQECAPIEQVVRLARSRVARPLNARERAHYLD